MTIIFFSLRPICILSLRVISFYRSVAFHRTVCLSTIEREGKKKQRNEEKKNHDEEYYFVEYINKKNGKKIIFFLLLCFSNIAQLP